MPVSLKNQPNAPTFTDQANQAFTSALGRPATQQEIDYLLNVYGGPNRAVEALNNHINAINQKKTEVKNLGRSYGVDFDDATATQLVDQVFKAGDSESFNNFRGYVEPIVARKADEQQRQQLTNPTVAPDQNAAHQQTVNGLVKEIYGRDASPDELSFFANELAKGDSPYELRQFLMQTPEYQKKQADAENEKYKTESAAVRQSLDQELQNSNLELLNRATPQIIGQFMRAGRLGSSGVVNAVARAQADLDKERQVFLANAAYSDATRQQGYSRENFVGSQNQAYQQYLRQSDPRQQANTQNAMLPYNSLNRQYGLIDQGRQRQYDQQDYNSQRNDYLDALSQGRKDSRESALYGLGGSLLGTGLQGLTYGFARR